MVTSWPLGAGVKTFSAVVLALVAGHAGQLSGGVAGLAGIADKLPTWFL
jgi:hypothetical protein